MSSSDRTSLDLARRRLAQIWFAGSGVFLLLIIGQAIGTVYRNQTQDLFSWALPTFLPTLSLILSVLAANAIVPPDAAEDETQVRRTFYDLSLWISVFYLVVLIGSTIAAPLAASSINDASYKALNVLQLSNFWLTPLQSLVVVITGTMFFTKEKSGRPAPS